MADYKKVFRRNENKYLLSQEQYEDLMRVMKPALASDEYAGSIIGSIYLDTLDFRIIRASLEKPLYKEKLRLRSYGVPNPSDKVFVELKKKYKGVVYKRRISMDQAQAKAYIMQGERPKKDSQILHEIDWFIHTHDDLAPAMLITCDRMAYHAKEDPELRLTFDTNILFRNEDLEFSSGVYGSPLLLPGQQLMEIKLTNAMPMRLAHMLDERNIRQCSFSKYGGAYKSIMDKGAKLRGVKGEQTCA